MFRKNFDGMKINSIISWLRSDENLTHLPTRQLSLIRFRWKICMSPVFVFQTLKWIRTGDCSVGSGDVLRTFTDSSFRWCKLLAYLENQWQLFFIKVNPKGKTKPWDLAKYFSRAAVVAHVTVLCAIDLKALCSILHMEDFQTFLFQESILT